MSRTVIVPNELHDAIMQKLDEAYRKTPEAEVDRDAHYHVLLEHFDQHGTLPDFSLKRIQ